MPRLDDDQSQAAPPLEPAGNDDGSDEWVAAYHGNALRLDEAIQIGAAHPFRLIVLAGEKGVGKTTLLAELHQAFLRGPFAGQLFAGSRTLPAFEQRCHRARTASNRDEAHTTRTRLSAGVHILHLAVRDQSLAAPAQHLLLADVSGEFYSGMRMRKSDADDFAPLLRRASRVVFVVDGQALASAKTRQATRTNARTLQRALIETNGITDTTNVDVVLSKWDRVHLEGAVDHAERFLDEELTRLRDQVREIATHRLAVRSDTPDVKRHLGLAGLLKKWTHESPALHLRTHARPKLRPGARSFLRFRKEEVNG